MILRGEKSGLHTRVFINSLGIPVYEAKELGLAPLKYHDFPYDLSLVVTGNEIVDYFKVLMKALGFINPELASKTRHVPHGMLRLTSGKMSSRTGKIITGETLIDEVKEVVLGKMDMAEFGLSKEEVEQVADHIAVAALKYDVLRRGIGRDVVFDKEQAISLTGNTGPYLQYTHARANSVLEKAKDEGKEMSLDGFFVNNRYAESIDEKELDVARHLYKFPEIVYSAARDLSPGDVCGYLFKLAQLFNVFYNDIRIINAGTEMELDARLYLTSAVKNVMKTGLSLLGIEAPNKI